MNKTLRTLLALTLVLALAMGLVSVAEAKTATRITMSRRALSMDWGTRYTLAVTVTPTNASDKGTIAWESSDPLTVSVQADASTRKATVTVRGKAGAEPYPAAPVVITATTSQGKTATCTITIKQIDVKSISVSPSSKTVYLTQSSPTYPMPAPSFNPSVAGDQLSYSWSTNNDKVATVDAGGLVTFTGEGTARITATYASGTVTTSDYCTFTVKPIRVKSISLDTTINYLDQGESFQLNAKVTSSVSGKLPSYPKVTWSSADKSVADVDEDGKVTAKGKSGIVRITASVDKAPYVRSASCLVYVRDVSPTRVTITAGGDCVLGGDPRKGNGVLTARSTQERYQKLISANGPQYPFEKVAKLFASNGPDGRDQSVHRQPGGLSDLQGRLGHRHRQKVPLPRQSRKRAGAEASGDRRRQHRQQPHRRLRRIQLQEYRRQRHYLQRQGVKRSRALRLQPLLRRQLRACQDGGRQAHRLLRHPGQPAAAVSAGKPSQEGSRTTTTWTCWCSPSIGRDRRSTSGPSPPP